MESIFEVGSKPGKLPLDVKDQSTEKTPGELEGVVLSVVGLLRHKDVVVVLVLVVLRHVVLLDPLLHLLSGHQPRLGRGGGLGRIQPGAKEN